MGIYNPAPQQQQQITQYIPRITDCVTVDVGIAEDILGTVLEYQPTRTKTIIWNKSTTKVFFYLVSDNSIISPVESFYLEPDGYFIDEYPCYQGTIKAKSLDGSVDLSVTAYFDLTIPALSI